MKNSKEEYLKVIWHLGGRKRKIAPKEIASKMNVQAASVTEMLLKLTRDGLINYEPYRGANLTEKGIEQCTSLVRSHEIWEVFLVRYLGYRLSEAHDEADLLEHATSLRLMERLDLFLNYPTLCPHGSQVPRPGSLSDKRLLTPLTDLVPGDIAIIARIEEEADLLEYLEKLGLKVPMEVKIISHGDYGGPIQIGAVKEDKQFSINLKAAEKIYVIQGN